MKERLLIGLDVGTTAIRLAAGKVSVGQDRRLSLNIVGGAEVASQGVSKGSISSIEDAVSAISSCLEQAERVIGESVAEAAVGIGGTYITSQDARGVIGVWFPAGGRINLVLNDLSAASNTGEIWFIGCKRFALA
jgi:cell division protein FtsA